MVSWRLHALRPIDIAWLFEPSAGIQRKAVDPDRLRLTDLTFVGCDDEFGVGVARDIVLIGQHEVREDHLFAPGPSDRGRHKLPGGGK